MNKKNEVLLRFSNAIMAEKFMEYFSEYGQYHFCEELESSTDNIILTSFDFDEYKF